MGKYTPIIYTWPHSLECEKCVHGISLMDNQVKDMGAICKKEHDKPLRSWAGDNEEPCLKFLKKD